MTRPEIDSVGDVRDVFDYLSDRDLDNIRTPTNTEVWLIFDAEAHVAKLRLILQLDQPSITLQYHDGDWEWGDVWSNKSRY